MNIQVQPPCNLVQGLQINSHKEQESLNHRAAGDVTATNYIEQVFDMSIAESTINKRHVDIFNFKGNVMVVPVRELYKNVTI
jgi:hypothetical protein